MKVYKQALEEKELVLDTSKEPHYIVIELPNGIEFMIKSDYVTFERDVLRIRLLPQGPIKRIIMMPDVANSIFVGTDELPF